MKIKIPPLRRRSVTLEELKSNIPTCLQAVEKTTGLTVPKVCKLLNVTEEEMSGLQFDWMIEALWVKEFKILGLAVQTSVVRHIETDFIFADSNMLSRQKPLEFLKTLETCPDAEESVK